MLAACHQHKTTWDPPEVWSEDLTWGCEMTSLGFNCRCFMVWDTVQNHFSAQADCVCALACYCTNCPAPRPAPPLQSVCPVHRSLNRLGSRQTQCAYVCSNTHTHTHTHVQTPTEIIPAGCFLLFRSLSNVFAQGRPTISADQLTSRLTENALSLSANLQIKYTKHCLLTTFLVTDVTD